MTAPQDAVITHENGVFQVSQSSAGQEVDIDATTKALNEALAGGLSEPVSVDATVKIQSRPARQRHYLRFRMHLEHSVPDSTRKCVAFQESAERCGEDQRHGSDAGRRIFGLYMAHPIYGGKWLCIGRFLCERSGSRYGRRWRCQICTTLYNAALLAEMDITQRQNHSMIVVVTTCRSGIAGFGDRGYLYGSEI